LARRFLNGPRIGHEESTVGRKGAVIGVVNEVPEGHVRAIFENLPYLMMLGITDIEVSFCVQSDSQQCAAFDGGELGHLATQRNAVDLTSFAPRPKTTTKRVPTYPLGVVKVLREDAQFERGGDGTGHV
jgi:hypothetical protein